MSSSKRERPLSPHLQVYRWQITMVMSILHRGSGVLLAFGTFLIACWLLALAGEPAGYEQFMQLTRSPLGYLVMAVGSAALVYHFLNGIRHLAWDIGWGFEIPRLYASGWSVLALTVVITGAIWVVALQRGGGA